MAVMTLLDAAKTWAHERDIGYRQRWVKTASSWELVLHFGSFDVEIAWAEWMAKAQVRAGGRLYRAATPLGMRRLLTSLTVHRGSKLCQSPRHATTGCPACGLARRGAGRKSKRVEIPKPPRIKPVQILPPDEVIELAPPALQSQPKTVEEAEAELERLMRQDAPPEALRAAGARLDKLLEKRPLN